MFLQHVVDNLIVYQEGTIKLLWGVVDGENRVVDLEQNSGNLGSSVYGELKLGHLIKTARNISHQQKGEFRTNSSTKTMRYQEVMKPYAPIS